MLREKWFHVWPAHQILEVFDGKHLDAIDYITISLGVAAQLPDLLRELLDKWLDVLSVFGCKQQYALHCLAFGLEEGEILSRDTHDLLE